MNYCRKCQSDYSTPGTCNCFAPIRVSPSPVVPWQQPVPLVPYVGDPIPCQPHRRVDTTTVPRVGDQWTYTIANNSGVHVQ